MKILLISGHTSGYNKSALTGVNEGDLNIELVKLLTPRLGRYADVTVYPYSRDMYHDNKNGQIQVNLKEFDYIFEVHFNDFNNAANGTEIYLHQDYAGGTSVEEKVLQNIVALGFRDRGVKRMSDLLNMNTCYTLGVDYALLEVCFYDNSADMARYRTSKEAVADAITAGIAEGFGLTPRETPNADALMLREMTDVEYIENLARLAQECWTKYGLLPSPTIAQGILEPACGKSELACGLGASADNIAKNGTAYGARNIFGLKRDISKGTWESDIWTGAVYLKQTAEQNKDGSYTNIWAYFRSYETIAECVEDRAQYLTRAHKENGDIRFPGIVGETDPQTACEIIAAGGYATSHNYAKNLMRVIQEYDLTRYDPVTVYEPWSAKVVNAAELNVRKSPNGEVMKLELNTLPSITVIGEAQDSDGDIWYRVKLGESVTGYVWPEYVSR